MFVKKQQLVKTKTTFSRFFNIWSSSQGAHEIFWVSKTNLGGHEISRVYKRVKVYFIWLVQAINLRLKLNSVRML